MGAPASTPTRRPGAAISWRPTLSSPVSRASCSHPRWPTSALHVTKRQTASVTQVTGFIAFAFGAGVVFTVLIAVVEGHFKYSGAGYCYIDWSKLWQSVLMEVICWPAWFGAVFCFFKCATNSTELEVASDSDTPQKDLVASK